MKHIALALVVSTLIISCALTPTPMQREALTTAAPQIETVTLATTDSPTATLTPTFTDTPTATPSVTYTLTSTPTQTTTPTPTEMPTVPHLEVEGAKFIKAGREVILRGAVVPRFVFKGEPRGNLQIFKREVDVLRNMGANFTVVEWNSGSEFVGNPIYRESLVQGLEYAKSRGLYVELSLHSRGGNPNSTWEPIQIRTLDRQIMDDWEELLSDSRIAARITGSVDIFGVLSEAKKNVTGGRPSLGDPILDETCRAIRSGTKNPNTICAISGADYGRDARELIGTSPKAPNNDNVIIEVHPYAPNLGFFEWVNQLRRAGYLVFVGEFGWWVDNTLEYNLEMIDFLEQHGISYAYYAIDIYSEDGRHAYDKDGLSRIGSELQKRWRSQNE